MSPPSARRPKFDLSTLEVSPGDPSPADPHVFNAIVGESIRRARQRHGWTQATLAERAGLSPNYIARLERGELGASLFVATKICEALDITLDSLMVRGHDAYSGKRAVVVE